MKKDYLGLLLALAFVVVILGLNCIPRVETQPEKVTLNKPTPVVIDESSYDIPQPIQNDIFDDLVVNDVEPVIVENELEPEPVPVVISVEPEPKPIPVVIAEKKEEVVSPAIPSAVVKAEVAPIYTVDCPNGVCPPQQSGYTQTYRQPVANHKIPQYNVRQQPRQPVYNNSGPIRRLFGR